MRIATSDLTVKFCDINDIDSILLLQEIVFNNLGENASFLRRNTKETFYRCLNLPNFTLGVYNSRELVAICIMEDARGNDDDLGMKTKETLSSYADFKLVMVKPQYVGNGLQKKLMWILEKIAYRLGYHYLCASVSPDNYYSRNNIVSMGYKYDSTNRLYGNLLRDIFIKELEVKKYNRMMLGLIGSIEGSSCLCLEGINLVQCFKGNQKVASTGDFVEYYDYDSGDSFFGIYIYSSESMVLLPDALKRKMVIVPYSEEIGTLKLKNIWIDTMCHEI